MKKALKISMTTGLLTLPVLVSAQWSASAGYTDFDRIGFGVAYASAGYQYNFDKFKIMPELRLGIGVSDADISEGRGALVPDSYEVDSFLSASVRGQYNVNTSFGIFLQPSYSKLKTTASVDGQEFTVDDWEFNLALGANYNFTENFAIEAIYEPVINDDAISVGFRYTF